MMDGMDVQKIITLYLFVSKDLKGLKGKSVLKASENSKSATLILFRPAAICNLKDFRPSFKNALELPGF